MMISPPVALPAALRSKALQISCGIFQDVAAVLIVPCLISVPLKIFEYQKLGVDEPAGKRSATLTAVAGVVLGSHCTSGDSRSSGNTVLLYGYSVLQGVPESARPTPSSAVATAVSVPRFSMRTTTSTRRVAVSAELAAVTRMGEAMPEKTVSEPVPLITARS